MFTGLVQGIGRVSGLVKHESSLELQLEVGELADGVSIGDSISINGICLTVTQRDSQRLSVDVMKQTLLLTSIQDVHVLDQVNLELAVLPTQRLGGHLVQGHVDGVGTVALREPGERWERFIIRVPSALMKYIVAQGSIAVNGVSLTVGSLNDDLSQIELWIIPETSAKTTFGSTQVGDKVNIEVDVLGKYVERLLERRTNS